MTLNDLWMEYGGTPIADAPLVFDLNGEGMVPVRGGMDFGKGGETVLYLTNMGGDPVVRQEVTFEHVADKVVIKTK